MSRARGDGSGWAEVLLASRSLETDFVPGMGNTSGPCACSHAKHSCAAEQPLTPGQRERAPLCDDSRTEHEHAPAIAARGAAQAAMFAAKLSAVNLGFMLRLSVAGRADGSMAPVSSPRQRGE
jgi:hypothetical protein